MFFVVYSFYAITDHQYTPACTDVRRFFARHWF